MAELLLPPELAAAIEAVDDPSRPIDLHAVAGAFQVVRATYPANDPRNFEGWLETIPFNLSIESESQGPFHSYFGPISSTTYEDGTVLYAPDPRQADDRALVLWAHRRDTSKHPVLVARYADVLWDLSYPIAGVKNDRKNAETAIRAYLAAADQDVCEDGYAKAAGVLRALSIACSLRNVALVREATASLIKLHDEMAHAPRYLDVVGALLWNRQIALDDHQRAAIVQELERRLDTYCNGGSPASFNPFEAKDIADILGRHYRRIGDDKEAKRVFALLGATFEHVATLGSAMQASAQLDTAIEAYQKAGDKDSVERLRIAKSEAVKGSVAEMTTHEFRHDVPKERVDEFVASVLHEDLGWSFARLAAKFVDRVSVLEKRVLSGAKAAPLQAFITMQIMEHDHVAATVGSVQDDLEGRVMQEAARSFSMDELFLGVTLDGLLEKHSATAMDIVAWANRLGSFSEGYLLRAGVEAWDKGDWVKAVHVLVPQIEAALRSILREVGGAIVKPHPQGGGREVLLSMSEVLSSERVNEAFGADLTLYFRAGYIDPRGWNLRNVLAHGLTGRGHVDRPTANFVVHSLLVLGCWRDISASRRQMDKGE